MKTKHYYLITVSFFISCFMFSQSNLEPVFTIELNNGEIINKEIPKFFRVAYSGKNRMTICDKNKTNCKKTSLTEIKEIRILDDLGKVQKFKVIYPKKKNVPFLCFLEYAGEKFEYYTWKEDRLITKVNDNKIIHGYKRGSLNQELRKLIKFFKGCDIFIKEATQKKALKKHDIYYYYALTDKCEI